MNIYSQATFLKSAAKFNQFPEDHGIEVAFAGRSNVGKSSALNCLTTQKKLAKISKTPGRTQLINLFTLDESRRLVDLPGYGYAQVPQKIKEAWQHNVTKYLECRQCLQGIILLVDCRHDPKELDHLMIQYALHRQLPIHILLTKIDKLSYSNAKNCVIKLHEYFSNISDLISVQPFSSTHHIGLEVLIDKLNEWFDYKS